MSSPLYLLLLLLFTVLISHRDAAAQEVVTDIKNQPLKSNINYYILPVIRGRGGGGLTISKSYNKNTTCPKSVVQDQNEVSQGIPLKFSPFDKSRTVHVSTDLNFIYSPTSIWRLDSFDETTNQRFVSTCGVAGSPGPKTISNWFKIEKFESDYKILFCPGVCNFCKVICRDVGVLVKDGKRMLVLSDVPLKVMFKRA